MVKNPLTNVGDNVGFDPCVGKIPWNRKWQPNPLFLPGKFHGQRSLAGYSPWGRKEPHATEHAHMLKRTSQSWVGSVLQFFLLSLPPSLSPSHSPYLPSFLSFYKALSSPSHLSKFSQSPILCPALSWAHMIPEKPSVEPGQDIICNRRGICSVWQPGGVNNLIPEEKAISQTGG